MNRMARLKLGLFTVGVLLVGFTNPVMFFPCTALGIYLLSKQAKAKRQYLAAQRVKADRDFARLFR